MQTTQQRIGRLAQMKAERVNFDAWWQRVADYVNPAREFTRRSNEGSRRNDTLIFNTAPIDASQQLVSILHGTLISDALRWFELHASDRELDKTPEVRAWMEDATDRMFDVFADPASGFQTTMHEALTEIVDFGNGNVFIDDDEEIGPIFVAVPLQESYIGLGDEGYVETVFRHYELRLEQIVSNEDWQDAITPELRTAAEKNPAEKRKILHATWPIQDDKSWGTEWVLEACGTVLKSGKYNSMPFAFGRWSKRSNEIYGVGCSMRALPDILLLNKQQEVQLRAAAKQADPTVLLPDDGFLDAFTTAPGTFNYYRAGTPGIDLIKTLPPGNLEPNEKQIELAQARIRRMFFLDLLQLPNQPNMTATEVLQRRDQLLRALGPMSARTSAELLGPIIHRVFDIMLRRRMFKPMPDALKRAPKYRVVYTSPLAQAQRSQDAETVMRFFAAAGQLAQYDPTVLRRVDADASLRFIQDRLGAPVLVMKAPALIAAEDAAAAAQQANQAEQGAALAAGKTALQGAQAFATLRQAGGLPGGTPAPQMAPPMVAGS